MKQDDKLQVPGKGLGLTATTIQAASIRVAWIPRDTCFSVIGEKGFANLTRIAI